MAGDPPPACRCRRVRAAALLGLPRWPLCASVVWKAFQAQHGLSTQRPRVRRSNLQLQVEPAFATFGQLLSAGMGSQQEEEEVEPGDNMTPGASQLDLTRLVATQVDFGQVGTSPVLHLSSKERSSSGAAAASHQQLAARVRGSALAQALDELERSSEASAYSCLFAGHEARPPADLSKVLHQCAVSWARHLQHWLLVPYPECLRMSVCL